MSIEQCALLVRNIKKVFRKRSGLWRRKVTEEWALKGVSFHVRVGETYGLLGPNGSGKSTLIRILSTLLLPDEGSVEVLGFQLPRDERQVRQRIGRVSVDAAFYKKLSAIENLLYNSYLYNFNRRTAIERATEILVKLGIKPERLNEPLEEMSRGMQQKVSITRALLVNPPLLLLDEPTTGLDPKSKRDVQEFLQELQRRGKTTILLTTHDMGEAERLCDRLGMLTHGRLVAEGQAGDLIRQAGAANLEDAFVSFAGERLSDEANEEVLQ